MTTYPLPLSHYIENVLPRQSKPGFFSPDMEELTFFNMISAAEREGDSYPNMSKVQLEILAEELGYEQVYNGRDCSVYYKYGLLLGAIHSYGWLEHLYLYGGPNWSDDVLVGLKYIEQKMDKSQLSEPFHPAVIKVFEPRLDIFRHILPREIFERLFDDYNDARNQGF